MQLPFIVPLSRINNLLGPINKVNILFKLQLSAERILSLGWHMRIRNVIHKYLRRLIEYDDE